MIPLTDDNLLPDVEILRLLEQYSPGAADAVSDRMGRIGEEYRAYESQSIGGLKIRTVFQTGGSPAGSFDKMIDFARQAIKIIYQSTPPQSNARAEARAALQQRAKEGISGDFARAGDYMRLAIRVVMQERGLTAKQIGLTTAQQASLSPIRITGWRPPELR